ncbi:uncharacterized protein LOC141707685 isoform X3 [Apium graveolens]|uniref:uncharacterized protein LOC141707685 isoform X3 n=1 Tax=Apium graveolens TaxID=4045 RepID=UPI003D79D9B0
MASYAAATIGISLSTNSSTTSPTSTVIDVNHPYYLSNSDNPCIPLVTQMLTDQNYSQWSRSASIALSAKMKLGHTRDKCFCLHGYPQWHGLHGNPKPKPKKLSTSGVKSAAQITVGHDVAAGSQIHMDNSAKDSVTFSEPQCLQLSKDLTLSKEREIRKLQDGLYKLHVSKLQSHSASRSSMTLVQSDVSHAKGIVLIKTMLILL